MITEEPTIDLKLLSEHFTEYGTYTKKVILEELEYWRGVTDFLALISRADDIIDGFLLGYRYRDFLWIAQVWHKSGTDLRVGKAAIEMAKIWSKERGITSMAFETKRNEMRALDKYGFKEKSINMVCEI